MFRGILQMASFLRNSANFNLAGISNEFPRFLVEFFGDFITFIYQENIIAEGVSDISRILGIVMLLLENFRMFDKFFRI